MPLPLFVLFTVLNLAFLLLGLLLLIRPASVIRFQLRGYVGRPVPDHAFARFITRLTARMPRFMLDHPGEDPAKSRDELYANPSAFPRVINSYRMMGAFMLFIGGMWWIQILV